MPQTYREAMRTLERALLTAELALHGGNISATARDLKMSLRNLHYRIHKLGLVPPGRSPEVSGSPGASRQTPEVPNE